MRFKSKGTRARAKAAGYRSGLEESLATFLSSNGVDALFETQKIDYVIPASKHKYTPDFLLPNGIFIESKGRFVTQDKKKHLLIKEQYPELDIRFVFQNPNGTATKGAKSTYADWCRKYGFQFCSKNDHQTILDWTNEPTRSNRETGESPKPAQREEA